MCLPVPLPPCRPAGGGGFLKGLGGAAGRTAGILLEGLGGLAGTAGGSVVVEIFWRVSYTHDASMYVCYSFVDPH